MKKVPLLGRSGVIAPPDPLLGALVGLFVALGSGCLMAPVHAADAMTAHHLKNLAKLELELDREVEVEEPLTSSSSSSNVVDDSDSISTRKSDDDGIRGGDGDNDGTGSIARDIDSGEILGGTSANLDPAASVGLGKHVFGSVGSGDGDGGGGGGSSDQDDASGRDKGISGGRDKDGSGRLTVLPLLVRRLLQVSGAVAAFVVFAAIPSTGPQQEQQHQAPPRPSSSSSSSSSSSLSSSSASSVSSPTSLSSSPSPSPPLWTTPEPPWRSAFAASMGVRGLG